ncbi:hypothetical protein FH972_016018 [Carpinus fangiana]|uniref:Tim10-like domain-containing protein n=1 Tax=Carpinus fangiana TaxID=176857 RepID=A0A5N6RGL4_9ROSI|nr:hypothetical protein FH972_016018 [Carpinus fangiana]
MESLIILNYFTIFVSCFCMILLYASTLNPVFALKNCTFPAIFNFGDSNSDTGGLAAAAFITPTPPFGETFFHMPAGRFSDGRLIIDFMAKSVGLPYLSAYLDFFGTNSKHGANFATAASTIRLPKIIMPAKSGYSPFYLDVQYLQFVQFKIRSQIIRQKGGIYANLMPKRDYFPKALYTFDIGQNDLGEGFSSNMTIEEVNASVPDMVNKFSTNVKASPPTSTSTSPSLGQTTHLQLRRPNGIGTATTTHHHRRHQNSVSMLNTENKTNMDKSMLGDLDNLLEEDKLRMSSMIDQLQIRDRMYNSLVERCFNDCVDTFKHKSLQKQEETCVRRCVEKFLKHSMRVGMRFAELNQGAATQD